MKKELNPFVTLVVVVGMVAVVVSRSVSLWLIGTDSPEKLRLAATRAPLGAELRRPFAEESVEPALRLADGEEPRELRALERVAAAHPDQRRRRIERDDAPVAHPPPQPLLGVVHNIIDQPRTPGLFIAEGRFEEQRAPAETPGGARPDLRRVEVQRGRPEENREIGEEAGRGGEAAHLPFADRDRAFGAREQFVERTTVEPAQVGGPEHDHLKIEKTRPRTP